MNKVLIPVDGSECALRGVALVLSKRPLYLNPEDLEIHLVNVQASLSQDVTRFVSQDQISSFQREESEETMQEACRVLDEAGARYSCHHEVGNVAETITNLAEALHCDQIVMGTHGRGAFRDFLMGSITMKVVNLSKIPILLVK